MSGLVGWLVGSLISWLLSKNHSGPPNGMVEQGRKCECASPVCNCPILKVSGKIITILPLLSDDRLAGLVVRRPPRERKVPGSNPACAGIFSGSSHTSDLNIGTPVATLPGAWHYRVSAGTGRPGVSIL